MKSARGVGEQLALLLASSASIMLPRLAYKIAVYAPVSN